MPYFKKELFNLYYIKDYSVGRIAKKYNIYTNAIYNLLNCIGYQRREPCLK